MILISAFAFECILHRTLSFQFKCDSPAVPRSITRNNMQIAGWCLPRNEKSRFIKCMLIIKWFETEDREYLHTFISHTDKYFEEIRLTDARSWYLFSSVRARSVHKPVLYIAVLSFARRDLSWQKAEWIAVCVTVPSVISTQNVIIELSVCQDRKLLISFLYHVKTSFCYAYQRKRKKESEWVNALLKTIFLFIW